MTDTRDSANPESTERPEGTQPHQTQQPQAPELSNPWGGIPPVPLGSGPAFQAVGEVAAPLLAGFSIALLGVIAQSPGSFRWAGLSLLILTFAAGLLLFAVQAGFHARQMYWTRDELLAWFKGPLTEKSDEVFSSMHRTQRDQWEAWIDRTRRSYNAGTILLMLGLAIILAPPAAYGSEEISAAEAQLRWAAAALATALAVTEIIWWSLRGNYKKEMRS